MVNVSKLLLLIILLFTATIFIVDTKREDTTIQAKKNSDSLIQSAVSLATLKLLDIKDINSTYEGNLREPNDIPINYDARNVFIHTLKRSSSLTNDQIPLVGYATFKYVVGITGDDNILPPSYYTFPLNDGRIALFTQSDKVYIDDEEYVMSGVLLKSTLLEEVIDITYTGFTAEQLRNYVIVETVAEYMNCYGGTTENMQVLNNGVGFEVNLTHQLNEDTGAVLIEHPTVFAVIDLRDRQVIALGGGEIDLWR